MAWTSLSLVVAGDDAESWSDALLEAGAISVDVHDAAAGTADEKPQFGEPGEALPGAWERNVVTALFDPAHDPTMDPRAIVSAIASEWGLAEPPFALSTVEERDWVRLTQSQFEPIRISSRMWILPSWHQAVDPDAINLIIDPGLAFGTGSHATTRLCLQWLEAHVQPGERVLDYGCGSGILAIAAKRLGAGEVTGTDVDPQAIEAARANAALNRVDATFVTPEALDALVDQGVSGGVGGGIDQVVGSGVDSGVDRRVDNGVYDIVVANILTNPLRMLAPAIAARVRHGGRIVLSGVLADQSLSVVEAYEPWFNITAWRIADGWTALAGTRR